MNQTNERFISLDVFRGLTICLMIIVNTPGFGAHPYWPLEHSHWNGFTPTDWVFPSFMFAVGNAMSFAMKKYEAMGNKAVLTKIFKRTILIFLTGYLMYWFPFFRLDKAGHIISAPFSHTRIMGVLQRIALAYCVASLVIHYFSQRTAIIFTILLLLGYWAVVMAFGDPGAQLTMTGNAGLHLDKFLFGDNHLYHGEGIPFDPEGVLSTLPSIGNVIAGYLTGKFIQKKGKNFECISKMMLAGNLLIGLALLWNLVFPINKKLWTSSYVLYTVGLDLVILAILIYFIEMKSWKRGTKFFLVFGKNPLPIYVLSELLIVVLMMIRVAPKTNFSMWINQVFFQHISPGPFGSLLFALCYMLVCWSFGWWLDKRKIYIRA
ncbi:MAG: acyltransferase family protein [Chitinophagaceae bacterium]